MCTLYVCGDNCEIIIRKKGPGAIYAGLTPEYTLNTLTNEWTAVWDGLHLAGQHPNKHAAWKMLAHATFHFFEDHVNRDEESCSLDTELQPPTWTKSTISDSEAETRMRTWGRYSLRMRTEFGE